MSTQAPPVPAEETEFNAKRHVYEPHKVGLPPIGQYLRELWRRREFGAELSRTNLRAQHVNTIFGVLWLVINPLLLAAIYFVLVDILQKGSRNEDFFAHLVAGLFAYYFISQAARQSVRAVTSGGRLILNTAFPRVLLPLASVRTAFVRFLPPMALYAVLHLVTGLPIEATLLWTLPLVALMLVMSAGLAMLLSAGQVYFRDLKEFLPYGLRIWLYASPILYYADEIPERYKAILWVNPIGELLNAWSDVLNKGQAPEPKSLAIASAWAFGLLIVGALFFMSREREFAVRL